MKTFTLTKEGKTQKINQLKHDLFAFGTKAYTLEHDNLKRKEYHILEDVELLYFKNFNFNDTIRFSCQNRDTILMLENCSFSKTTNFHGGNVVLSAPRFNKSSPTVEFSGNKEVELHLEDEKTESNTPCYSLNGDIDSLYVTGKMADSLISTIGARVKRFQIKNLQFTALSRYRSYNLEWLNAQNIKIEDSNISTWVINPHCKNLEIKNSILEGDFLYLERTKTKLDNTTLRFSQIKLPEGILFEGDFDKHHEVHFSAFDSESTGNKKLAEVRFLSMLKAVEQRAKVGCEKKKEAITTEVEGRYYDIQAAWQQRLDHNIEKRDLYVERTEECQAVLDEIEIEIDQITERVEDDLKKQKVKTMIGNTLMKK